MPSAREAAPTGSAPQDLVARAHERHWRRNVRLTVALLVVWAAASLGCGVLFADALADITFLGFPLGFWFAQQGAIVTFVVLILVYALSMARLDRRLQRELDELDAANDDARSSS